MEKKELNQKILKFISEAGFFFFATTEDGMPRVRPLAYIEEIKDELIIAISTTKAMAKQIDAKPDFEICASTPETWLRIKGTAQSVTDKDVIAKAMECPVVKATYTEETVGARYLVLDSVEYFSLTGEYSRWK
ncbi:pyridoxamine 5'-phosphate oxidase family protein [Muricomes sp. OA1]|uniref:Pyridoxamine 5'-phosphate oxidase N-terminal domain-containing protein n=1 Tax=Hungatella hathewayi TaxID=154046 RepID=A0A3E2WRX9_9FIRM|nr:MULTISPECIES: pyridoxamine 5'-phosphate oxidase family protein [Clostridia]MCH1973639.1 pyridoxamine 5'-phosphate oxidase family protein [Muricomes sp. OA1]MRM87132.1 hypothetical protein [Faecalicatena contorta]RGC29613.1 hypothetical protein DWX41_13895 [Hungatella hathewayi]GKH32406.1 hypothetical protein CE91St64_18130 [Faecalicatena contorta]